MAVLLLVAAWLRLRVAGDVLWVDELHTSWTVAGELNDVTPRAVQGNQSPLYFWLVWAVTHVTGHNVLGLRALSIVASLGSVIAAGCLAWFYTRSRPAVYLLMLLVAVDVNFVFYATEARPYALAQFVALLHLLLLSLLVAREPSADPEQDFATHAQLAAAAAATALAMFYLHYTTALLLVAEGVAVVALMGFGLLHARRRWPALLAVALAVGIGCGLSAPQLLEIAARRSNWAMFIPRASRMALVELLNTGLYVGVAIAIAAPLMLLRGLPFEFLSRVPGLSGRGRRISFAWWIIAACWLVLPVGLAWCLNNFDVARLWHYRYLVTIALAPMLVACMLCASAGSNAMQWLAMLVLATTGVAYNVQQPYQQTQDGGFYMRNEDWRGAVQVVNQSEHNRGQPVLLYSGLIEADALLEEEVSPQLREYTLFPLQAMYRLDKKHHLQSLPTTKMGALPPDTLSELQSSGGCWLMVRGSPETAAQVRQGVQSYLRGSCRVAQRQHTGGVTVFRLETTGKR